MTSYQDRPDILRRLGVTYYNLSAQIVKVSAVAENNSEFYINDQLTPALDLRHEFDVPPGADYRLEGSGSFTFTEKIPG